MMKFVKVVTHMHESAHENRIEIKVMSESRRKQLGSSSSSSGASPCAACKLLRRRCAKDCAFAPHFPAHHPHKFACVHKVFGASNVNKMLQELPEHERGDAVSSMVYEANARIRDPVYGCVGAISSLQHQVDALQTQLAITQAEVVHMRMRELSMAGGGATNSPEKAVASTRHTTHHHSDADEGHDPFSMGMFVDQSNVGESLW